MKMPRMLVMKVHAFLACFFIPMATLFFISGAMYSLDIKGSIAKQIHPLALERPFAPDVEQLRGLVETALVQRSLPLPTGEATVAKKDGSYEFRWGDLKHLVVVHPTADPLQVELIYRQRSPLAQVMRVHRAEAGSVIRIFAAAMAVSLLVILASGVFLALGLPKLRRPALLSLGAGILALLPIFLRY